MENNVDVKAFVPMGFNSFATDIRRNKAAIDIIIPYYDQTNKVSRLVESIFRTVRTNRYQISLVNDASKNSSFSKDMAKIAGVKCFNHDVQRGFGACISTALASTEQPWVLILHSDVVVYGNLWLSKLGVTLQQLKEQGIKMVSPKTDNPGVDDIRLVGKKGELTDDIILEDGYLPLYCALCHRDLFKHVGEIKHNPYTGGEAKEFAQRMKSKGFLQAVCGSSWVHHEGGGTINKLMKKKSVREAVMS